MIGVPPHVLEQQVRQLHQRVTELERRAIEDRAAIQVLQAFSIRLGELVTGGGPTSWERLSLQDRAPLETLWKEVRGLGRREQEPIDVDRDKGRPS
ncbi:MAG: hypothetical protein GY788_21030 [bacterium]|nr:hypothetical protein [bacterium]